MEGYFWLLVVVTGETIEDEVVNKVVKSVVLLEATVDVEAVVDEV